MRQAIISPPPPAQRFRELPEDLASYGPLPGLLSAAASFLFSCLFVAFSVTGTINKKKGGKDHKKGQRAK